MPIKYKWTIVLLTPPISTAVYYITRDLSDANLRRVIYIEINTEIPKNRNTENIEIPQL